MVQVCFKTYSKQLPASVAILSRKERALWSYSPGVEEGDLNKYTMSSSL